MQCVGLCVLLCGSSRDLQQRLLHPVGSGSPPERRGRARGFSRSDVPSNDVHPDRVSVSLERARGPRLEADPPYGG